ncbi:MAG: MBL fold metallo-hydrolase [Cytophagaceae bacterium]|nr:MBL fold metallo-hydrolase [Cytophagaceae bacterium]
MKKYLWNPQLITIKENYPGNLYEKGQFSNYPWPDTNASFKNVFRWFVSRNPQKKDKKKENFRLDVIHDSKIFESRKNVIVWLGHASFFIRANGVNILIDPVLADLSIIKRKAAFPCEAADIRNIDFILLSHGHRDHLDEYSLKKIFAQNQQAVVLGPLQCEKLIRPISKKIKFQEAGWYQQYDIKNIKITFLPALHWHRRGLNDFNEVLWGSFMIETDAHKIFFAADTAYGSHFKEIKEVMGNPDICILPIGAYKPEFLMKQSHINPIEAIQAFRDMEGKKFIPMHYGTFDLADEPLGEPIKMLKENLEKKFLAELKVGEKFLI